MSGSGTAAVRPSDSPRGLRPAGYRAFAEYRESTARSGGVRSPDNASDVTVTPTLFREAHTRTGLVPGSTLIRTFATALLLAVTACSLLLPVGPAAAQSPPRVIEIGFGTSPLKGDTYSAGEVIGVYVVFDKPVISLGRSWLPIEVGAHVRRAWSRNILERRRAIVYRYIVREDDRDTDGITIAADALVSAAGIIRDGTDFAVDAVLTHSALPADATRKVDGTPSTPGVMVSPQNLAVAEGGTASYSVVLASPPSAAVRIATAPTTGSDADLTATPSELTFRASNWSTPQVVTISAGEDDDASNGKASFTHSASSSDPRYDNIEVAKVRALERDDEAGAGGARFSHVVPFFSAASNPARRGLLRVINHGHEAGTVSIAAIDDRGERFGPVTLLLRAGEAAYLNSGDLENGNPEKGLSGGVGTGTGDWWLELESALDIEALAFFQTADGHLTAMHDVAPPGPNGYRVAMFNPGSEAGQVSLLRLTNPGEEPATVRIAGTDDRGRLSEAETAVPAGETVTLTAKELEDLGLGDGRGKWQLQVASQQPLRVLNLLRSPSGHLTNLSTVPANVTIDDEGAVTHHVPFFPPSRRITAGTLRVINLDDEAGSVTIRAIDDAGRRRGTLALALEARESVDIHARDLERGNAAKGLSGRVAAGEGNWRLELESSLAINALAYGRTRDGFVASLHDLAPRAGDAYHAGVFNPGRQRSQVSSLRLVNPGETATEVSIVGVDDRGETREDGATVLVPAGAAATYTARELEEGFGEGLAGAIGIGVDRWRLRLSSEQPILPMNLVTSSSGYATSLSTSPGPRRDSDADGNPDFVDTDDDNDGVPDEADAFPLDASEWADSDGDGIGDNRDSDDGTATDIVVLGGRVTLQGALAGASLVFSAQNGIPVAEVETTATGDFDLSLDAAAIPEIVLLTAYGGVDQDAGPRDDPVANKGRVHAFATRSRLLDGSGATLNLSVLSEIVYQEARDRYPESGPAPSSSQLSAFLDEVARKYVDSGDYAEVLDFEAERDGASLTLGWDLISTGLAAAIRGGAGDADISNRVSALSLQFDDEGTVEDDFELRRVSGTGAGRVVTVSRAGEAGDIRSVRQTFIDGNGAYVDARLDRLSEEKSRVSIDISYAGRTFSIIGSSGILEDVPFTSAGLEAFASRVVTPSVQDDELIIDIDKTLSRAISDGELEFRVDGRTPREGEVSVLRDDPLIALELGEISSEDLEPLEGVEWNGEQMLAWANEDVLLIRVPNEEYAALSGLDEDVVAEAALKIGAEILVAVAAAQFPPTWVVSLGKLASSAYTAVSLLERAPDIGESLARSSRVVLRERTHGDGPAGAVSESIAPDRQYALDLFFKTTTCGKYSTLDYGYPFRDPLECPLIRLQVGSTDTFVYESHTLGVGSHGKTIRCPEGYSPPTTATRRCQRQDEAARSIQVVEFRQPEAPSTAQLVDPCDPADVSDSDYVPTFFEYLGTLLDIRCHSVPVIPFWIVLREHVEFELIDWEPRPGESLVFAHKSMQLTGNVDMYSRNLKYRLDVSELALRPEFHTRVERYGSRLVLDAKPTIIIPAAEKAFYRWTWRNPENGTSGLIGVDEVEPSESVLRRVPLSTFVTRGTSGVVDITLDLQVTGIRGGAGPAKLSKKIVRSVQVADATGPFIEEDEPLPSFEGVNVGSRTLVQGDTMAAWQLPEAEGGVAPLGYALPSPLPPGLSFDPRTRRLTGTPRETGTWSMRYVATDDYGGRASLSFGIQVVPKSNVPPRANAGPDQAVTSGTIVLLSGRQSFDSDGNVVRYTWSQISGTRVSLSGANSVNASFTAPTLSSGTTLTFRLRVTDDDGATDDDTVNVRVQPEGDENLRPEADAGVDRIVTSGDRVSLSGAGSSDPDGRVVSYAWSQIGGTGVTLSGANSATATFTAPTVSSETTLTFRLRVTDDDDATDDDTVNVRVRPAGGTGTGCTAVNIPDATLRRDVEDALNKSVGETITCSEMATLGTLLSNWFGFGGRVSQLTGLEHASNLVQLEFERNRVSDLSPLTGLTKLAILDASLNSISNISALSGLTALKSLDLSDNAITDISPLARNQGLGTGTFIYLNGNPLNSTSIDDHIPELRARGVWILFP